MRAAVFLSVLLFYAAAPPASAQTQGFDHSPWDQFLKKYVNEQGEVNYKGASADPALLNT